MSLPVSPFLDVPIPRVPHDVPVSLPYLGVSSAPSAGPRHHLGQLGQQRAPVPGGPEGTSGTLGTLESPGVIEDTGDIVGVGHEGTLGAHRGSQAGAGGEGTLGEHRQDIGDIEGT